MNVGSSDWLDAAKLTDPNDPSWTTRSQTQTDIRKSWINLYPKLNRPKMEWLETVLTLFDLKPEMIQIETELTQNLTDPLYTDPKRPEPIQPVHNWLNPKLTRIRVWPDLILTWSNSNLK